MSGPLLSPLYVPTISPPILLYPVKLPSQPDRPGFLTAFRPSGMLMG